MKNIKQMVLVTRPWGLILPVICVSFSFSLAYYIYKIFNIEYFILTLLGIALLNASVDVLNDYFDYKKGLDSENSGTVKYRLHPIVHHVLSPRDTLLYGVILGVTSIAIAIYLTLFRFFAIIFGLIGFFMVYAYNGPPLSLKYKALGEIEVFITYSFIIVASYYISSGFISVIPLFDSLPIASIITAILIANNMRDMEVDKSNKIKTLAIIYPNKINVIYLFLLIFLPYSLVTLLTILGYLPMLDILILFTLPFSIKIANYVYNNLPIDSDPQTSKVLILFGLVYVFLTSLGSL
jgi:1,4-dihydroxy-2-naphthoate octaprenyltransferase